MHLLKEWDIVCRALEEGRQVILARKGGILDDGGRFVAAHPEFFLFPTFLHQTQQLKQALKPSEIPRLEEDAGRPDTGRVPLKTFCRVADVYEITDVAKLRALDAEHVWNTRFLEKRFEWGDERGLTLLVVRVHRLADEIILPMRPEYAGCKSWVDVGGDDIAPPTYPPSLSPSLTPVLSNEEFLRRRVRLQRILL